ARRPKCVLGAELQQLDGIEVLYAAADALRRVEQHVGLRAVGIAQHANTDTIHDQVAAAEIAESNRRAVRCNVRHILRFDYRETHQACRLTRLGRRLPEISAITVLQFAYCRLCRTV